MKKPNIEILIGIPASGKSTYALEKIKNNERIVRFNRDSYRLMLKDAQICNSKIEMLITTLLIDGVKDALMKNLDVIIDNTNLKKSYIMEYVKQFETMANISFKVFDIEPEVAIQRDENRQYKVGRDVILNMYKQFENLMNDIQFIDTIIKNGVKYKHRMSEYRIDGKIKNGKQNAVIVDIDGTIAHMNGKRGPYDLEKVDFDDFDERIGRIVNGLINDTKIIVVSGREDYCMRKTMEWLDRNNFHYDYIFMRKTGDNRKDSIVKKEIYENAIKHNFNVYAVFDDRKQVVDMWRNDLGLLCLQVAEGLF